jgi:hypothetical protein
LEEAIPRQTPWRPQKFISNSSALRKLTLAVAKFHGNAFLDDNVRGIAKKEAYLQMDITFAAELGYHTDVLTDADLDNDDPRKGFSLGGRTRCT